jgi:hypothetical protein
VCPTPAHAAPVCVSAGCAIACDPGYIDCNGDPSDGCEVDPTLDVYSCGGCGKACPSSAGSAPSCSGGVCSYGCVNGYLDCDGLATNLCEVNSKVDPLNCGLCDEVCPLYPGQTNWIPACANSTCGYVCPSGWLDCDGVSNGCEVNSLTSLLNCGSCGKVCSAPTQAQVNMEALCFGGSCKLDCWGGYGDCDTNPSNGCETYLPGSDTSNCGSCGKVCSAPTPAQVNMEALCYGGSCQLDCITGYGDCDADPTNGCEKDLFGNDPLNCGQCGNVCGCTCNAGSCGLC